MRLRIPCALALTLGLVGCGAKQPSGIQPSASDPSISTNFLNSDNEGQPTDSTKPGPDISDPDVIATPVRPDPVLQEAPIAIPNGRLYAGFIIGGLPSREQIDGALVADIDSAMSLMATGEGQGDAIAGYASGKGFRYLHFAIDGIEDLNEAAAWEFAATLSMVDKPAIIHSQHGRRVGAIFALMAFFVDELPALEAYEVGRAAGMGDLSGHVRTVLGLSAD